MKFIAIITRTLREGKTLQDYRDAWFHSRGFGVPTTMYTSVNIANPREVISIGVIDCELDQMHAALHVEVDDRLAHPLDSVIEPEIGRSSSVVAAVDDFSSAGELSPSPPQVDGVPSDFDSLPDLLSQVLAELSAASQRRDTLKAERDGSADPRP